MFDERSLAWRLFFPAWTTFQGMNMPERLESLLPRTESPGPGRVLVAFEADAGSLPALDDYEGIVAINSSLSGVRLRAAGFAYVARFAAVPSVEDTRWLIPLESGSLAAGGLDLYTPYRVGAKLKRRALQLALRMGALSLRRQQIMVGARQVPAMLEAMASLSRTPHVYAAVTTGTPGPARKPTLAALDARGRTLAYAKIATSDTAARLLSNEALILRRLGQESRLAGRVPRLLFEGQVDGWPVTVQSPVAGKQAPLHAGPPHHRFLDLLEDHAPRPVACSAFLRSLHERASMRAGLPPEVRTVLDRSILTLAGIALPGRLLHGDFAPWNLRRQTDGLAAFDWEYGELDGLPGLDELHHLWQVGFLLDGWSTAQGKEALEAWAKQAPYGLSPGPARALTSLYLVHALLRRLEAGGDGSDDLSSHYFAALRRRAGAEEMVLV